MICTIVPVTSKMLTGDAPFRIYPISGRSLTESCFFIDRKNPEYSASFRFRFQTEDSIHWGVTKSRPEQIVCLSQPAGTKVSFDVTSDLETLWSHDYRVPANDSNSVLETFIKKNEKGATAEACVKYLNGENGTAILSIVGMSDSKNITIDALESGEACVPVNSSAYMEATMYTVSNAYHVGSRTESYYMGPSVVSPRGQSADLNASAEERL